MGIKPFHYFFDGPTFSLCQKSSRCCNFPFVPKKINERVVYEYLAHAAVEYSAETFFAGIMQLLPGHYLTFDCRTQKLDLNNITNRPLR